MPQAHETRKILNSGTIVKDLGSHAIALALINPSPRATCSYTTCILPSMLEVIERVVEVCRCSSARGVRSVVPEDESENAAHIAVFENESEIDILLGSS
jgi:hypothetical protein